MNQTKQAWLYKDGHFERTVIEWDEAIENSSDRRLELDRYLKQLGFSCLSQQGSNNDPLVMNLYQRDIEKEAKYSYEYLVVIPQLRWEIVFCNAFPDLLEWINKYSTILLVESMLKLQTPV